MPEPVEAQATVPASEPDQLMKVLRWLEGHVDENGNRTPGLIEMVGEIYKEHQLRKERREAIGRALASGGILAAVTICWSWVREHLK